MTNTADQTNVMWAAMMLAKDVATFDSIMAGRTVSVRHLDKLVLRRGLRGKRPPPPEGYLDVTVEILEAIAEEGPADLEDWTIRPLRMRLDGKEMVFEMKPRTLKLVPKEKS